MENVKSDEKAKEAVPPQAVQKREGAPAVLPLKRAPVGAFPATLEGAKQMAREFVRSGMYPSLGDNPDRAVARAFLVIQKGMEMGLPPVRAMQDIVVVNGHMSLRVEAARALMFQAGQVGDYKVEQVGTYEGVNSKDDFGYRVTGRRRDQGNRELETVFTVAHAKTAKLWGKKGKDGQDTPWITWPDRMLRNRAEGFFSRDHFSDMLQGHLMMEDEARDLEESVEVVSRDLGEAAPGKINPTLGDAISGRRPAVPEACPEALGEDGAYDEIEAERAREASQGEGPEDLPAMKLERAGKQPRGEPCIGPGRVRKLLVLMESAMKNPDLARLVSDDGEGDGMTPAQAMEFVVSNSCNGKNLPEKDRKSVV